MADQTRSLNDIDAYLRAAPALRSGEALGIFKELTQHMLPQQREIDALKRDGQGDAGGTPILRSPDGKVHL